ncbi:hypothetical protein ABBQ32_013219 [Trebouxia sp. C0010 RCD-2024]
MLLRCWAVGAQPEDILTGGCTLQKLDTGMDFCLPLAATGLTVPVGLLRALCHHIIRCHHLLGSPREGWSIEAFVLTQYCAYINRCSQQQRIDWAASGGRRPYWSADQQGSGQLMSLLRPAAFWRDELILSLSSLPDLSALI